MENDNNAIELSSEIIGSNVDNNIFQLEYQNQVLDNNIKFQKWKNSMLKKYGSDAKLFKCKKDNILFFISKGNTLQAPCYLKKCPICRELICYFCSYYYLSIFTHVYCSLIYYPLKFARDENNNQKVFNHATFFIPGVNILFIGLSFLEILYLDVGTKESKDKEFEELKEYWEKLNDFYLFIDYSVYFLLSIPLFIYNVIIIIFLLIITIPFKNYYPLRRYYNIISTDD